MSQAYAKQKVPRSSWMWVGAAFLFGPAAVQAGGADQDSLFSRQVAPILQKRCLPCHNAQKSRGGLNLTNRELLLKGGENGPAIVPGDPAKSLLVRMIGGSAPQMPKQGDPLKPEEIIAIRT